VRQRRMLSWALVLATALPAMARGDDELPRPKPAKLPDLGMEVKRDVPDAGPVIDAGPPLLPDGGLAPVAPPDQAAILKAIEAIQPGITACVEDEHRHHPGWLATKVSAGFTLTPKGEVTGVKLGDPKLHKSKLGTCLRAALAKVQLPAFDGEAMLIEVPLVLHSRGSGEPADRASGAP
jgi:hypothetical protein